jgi:hypothetical protein
VTAVARQLVDRVIIHASPPRKPPGITVEGHLARMLTLAQRDLPEGVANDIARAARLSVKEGTGGQRPIGVNLSFCD